MKTWIAIHSRTNADRGVTRAAKRCHGVSQPRISQQGEVPNDFLRRRVWRHCPGIKHQAVAPRDRHDVPARAKAVQRFNRGDFLFARHGQRCSPAERPLVLGAIEEHGKHFAIVPLQDSFDSFKSFAVFRLRVAICRGYQGNSVPGCEVQRRQPDDIHKLPKSRCTEVKHGPREVDWGVVVKQTSRHSTEQRPGDRQLPRSQARHG